MPVTILFVDVELPDELVRESVPTWARGRWLESYDPTVGLTSLVLTDDRSKARKFTPAAAMDLWQSVDTATPIGPDGKWNKPLTSFTVELDKAS